MLYWHRVSETELEARARRADDGFSLVLTLRTQYLGTGANPDVYGYSVLPAHQAAGADPTVVYSGSSTAFPATTVWTRNWVRAQWASA